MVRVTYRDGCGDGDEVMVYKPYNGAYITASKPEEEVLIESHKFGHTVISTFTVNPKAKALVYISTGEKRNDTKHEYKHCRKQYAWCQFVEWYSRLMEIRLAVYLSKGGYRGD